MNSIENLTFRQFAGQSDYPKMAKLLQDIAIADQLGIWATTEEVENDYQHLFNCDPALDMCMVDCPDGELAGYARVYWTKDDDGRQVFGFPFNIHPAYRSVELNRRLLQWVEERCAQIAEGERPLMRVFLNKASENQPFKEALDAGGYVPARYGYRMQRDLNEPIIIPEMPGDLAVRPVEPSAYRTVLNALDEAFRDHWGHTPMTDEMYEQYRASSNFQPALWVVAWEGSQVAGGILNWIDEAANKQFNHQLGWTDPIFTCQPWRKRGLARALLMRSLQLLKDRGMNQAALGVDTQNPSGALGFYESCGFKMEHLSIIYEKDVPVSVL
jgi:mycothiol synthase